MNLLGMRFKDFIWRDNPTSLTVSEERSLRETVLPYSGTAVEDLGRKRRKVTGEGYFTGADCWERWNELRALWSAGGPGTLQLPGQEPFLALLESLRLMGAAGKDLVKYAFSFVEYCSGSEDTGAGCYHAAAGESLWDYAWRLGRTVEEMRAANPHIRDIGALKEGEEVVAP